MKRYPSKRLAVFLAALAGLPHLAAAQEPVGLWSEGGMPSVTRYETYDSRYQDPPGFRPNLLHFPVAEGVEPKGAVLVCAGGAFLFRSNDNEGFPVAEKLSELGYQAFVVNYRVCPYAMEEGSLDLARAVRYVRQRADENRIDGRNIAVVGFSAGGILCGDFALHFSGNTDGRALDAAYKPDALDGVSADVCAVGMIYAFYGCLGVASTDTEAFRAAGLPPSFFAYGTRDPFYRQFKDCTQALRQAGVAVEEHELQGLPHGVGLGDGAWAILFDQWLQPIMSSHRALP